MPRPERPTTKSYIIDMSKRFLEEIKRDTGVRIDRISADWSEVTTLDSDNREWKMNGIKVTSGMWF